MSADLTIHIRTDEITDEVMAGFQGELIEEDGRYYRCITDEDEYDRCSDLIHETPQCWVGEVVQLFEDVDVPSPFERIYELFPHEVPTLITEEIVESMKEIRPTMKFATVNRL